MEEKTVKKRAGIKTAVIILSVLLAVSVAALAGVLVYRQFFGGSQPTSVTVPDNIITPEKSTSDGGQSSSDTAGNSESVATGTVSHSSDSGSESVKANAVYLHNRKADDNTPFRVGNMFPGDRETKYFCVRVSHKGDVIVRYHADVRPGYEKLAEVLKCRIVLPEKGKVLYDGLMRDMPQSLNHSLATDKSTESELYYEITAYLDTSVGNDYQNKDLIADFRWWVEEIENLDSPKTGDSTNILLWLCLAAGSLAVLILINAKRRKEEGHEQQ